MRKIVCLIKIIMLSVFIAIAKPKIMAVATFNINNNAVSEEEAEGVTELYIAELVSTGKVSVVDRNNFNKLLKEMCAEYRGGGYDDWYLPSKEELNFIYENLVKTGNIIGSGWFWSSSVYNNSYAWSQSFSYGYRHASYKDNMDSVRAVRAFK